MPARAIAGASARIALHTGSRKSSMIPVGARRGVSEKPSGGWRRKPALATFSAWRVAIGSSSDSTAALRPVAWNPGCGSRSRRRTSVTPRSARK